MGTDKCSNIPKALQLFALEGSVDGYERYGSGHINDTFKVTTLTEGKELHYILQRMNDDIFKDPVSLMRNIAGVTGFLRKKIEENGGDPSRETLNLVKTKAGEDYLLDNLGNYWRVYEFIENATCFNLVEKPEDFYQSGKAFGNFQRLLSDYPADQLSETIPDFHNSPARFRKFLRVVSEDACQRALRVQKEIKFIMDRADELGVAQKMLEKGELPLRVTHNDTKLNNIMIDDVTGQALCIIDLDTIMPGLSIFDFGDSIRFGANTAAEDETDLSKVSLSLELFDVYTKGFLEGCQGSLTEAEIDMLAMGAKLMTLECGMRFLTDYLEGDVYFKIHREDHNLDRARTQFALAADMEKKWDDMKAAVKKYK